MVTRFLGDSEYPVEDADPTGAPQVPLGGLSWSRKPLLLPPSVFLANDGWAAIGGSFPVAAVPSANVAPIV